jgi:hypothetical protein
MPSSSCDVSVGNRVVAVDLGKLPSSRSTGAGTEFDIGDRPIDRLIGFQGASAERNCPPCFLPSAGPKEDEPTAAELADRIKSLWATSTVEVTQEREG